MGFEAVWSGCNWKSDRHIVDALNALMPIFSAYHRSRCEGGIEIIIEKNMPQSPGLDGNTSPPESILV